MEIVDQKLDCGDYTTENLKNTVVIERKASATEIANNLGKKTAKARFYREFEGMETLERAYIVCEFSESDVYEFPKNSELAFKIQDIKDSIEEVTNVKLTAYAQKILDNRKEALEKLENRYNRIRMNGKYLRKLIHQIEDDCPNIEVVFCGNRDAAEKFTYDTLSFWEKNSGAKS